MWVPVESPLRRPGDNKVNTKSQSLHASVSEMLGQYGLSTFSRYWKLCNQAERMKDVEAFYCFATAEPKYGNVAIITNGKVIDVEGDDSDGSGSVTIRDLSSIAAVHLRTAPIEGYKRAESASLAVSTRLVGESNAGPYWVAVTAQEEERLIQFTSALTDFISHR